MQDFKKKEDDDPKPLKDIKDYRVNYGEIIENPQMHNYPVK